MAISSTECSTWFAVYLTITVAIVAVNLLSIILFVKNSNLRTRAMYLVINLTVADMFVGGIATVLIVFHFLLNGCEMRFRSKQFLAAQERQPFLVIVMIDSWLFLTSVTGITVISLDRMHATFRPFKHGNIKKWAYGVTIAGVWTLTAMILIPLPLISLYGNLHQQWQLLFPFYLWRSYCFLCLIVICVSYTSIALKFWCGTRPPSHGAANRQRKLTVTLFAVVVPDIILTFLSLTVIHSLPFPTFLRLKLYFILLYHTNLLVNPIIYTIRMPEFRRALLISFKRRQGQNAVIPLQAR